MLICTKNLKVEIDEKNGNILSVQNGQKEFLTTEIRQPLFRVCLMNELGVQERVVSDSARRIVFSEENHVFCWRYEAVSGKAFDAKAWMFVGKDGHLHISMEFDNRTASAPFILVAAQREISPGSLPAARAASRIFSRMAATFSVMDMGSLPF